MSYDVQRWDLVLVNASGSGYVTKRSDAGEWVRAADAEAHEKAAVQAALEDERQAAVIRMWRLPMERTHRSCPDCLSENSYTVVEINSVIRALLGEKP